MLLKICITATLETQTAFVTFQINKTILLLIHLHASSWNLQKYHEHSRATDNSPLTFDCHGSRYNGDAMNQHSKPVRR